MSSVVRNVAIDCADAYGLACFWSETTGTPPGPGGRPDDPEVQGTQAVGPASRFHQVPESRTVKNRLHLCLRPETTREPEVERLLGLGAILVADRRESDGPGGAVLAEPEGTGSCVPRSASGRAA
ncbi:VOC family protein [Streptomyces diastaticus]|uniref:VOC family protein n=1 Tax=Streptomyces diastaticus TaxID=1956 RepID=UPI00364EE4FB